MDDLAQTANNFSRKHIRLSQIWLRDCIQFFKGQSITGSNRTQEDLDKFVYTQWLFCDIREVAQPVLPEKANEQKKYTLKDNITLQLLSVIDISKSKYSQLQKIRSIVEKPLEDDVQNAEFRGNTKRCLQLTLTDGVQEIKAFEYKPVKSLTVSMRPGVKIRFNAPLLIRRGQILLDSDSNILVLGGEVEELLITNATENILAAALKLPLTNNPAEMGDKTSVRAKCDKNSNKISNNIKTKPTNTMNNYLNNIVSSNVSNKNTKQITKKPTKAQYSMEFDEDEFDEQLEIEAEIERGHIAKIKSQNNKVRSEVRSNRNITSQLKHISTEIGEDEFDQHLEIEAEIEKERIAKIKSQNSTVPSNKNTTTQFKHISREIGEDEFDQHLEIEAEIERERVSKLKAQNKKVRSTNNQIKNLSMELDEDEPRDEFIQELEIEAEVARDVYLIEAERERIAKLKSQNTKVRSNRNTSTQFKHISEEIDEDEFDQHIEIEAEIERERISKLNAQNKKVLSTVNSTSQIKHISMEIDKDEFDQQFEVEADIERERFAKLKAQTTKVQSKINGTINFKPKTPPKKQNKSTFSKSIFDDVDELDDLDLDTVPFYPDYPMTESDKALERQRFREQIAYIKVVENELKSYSHRNSLTTSEPKVSKPTQSCISKPPSDNIARRSLFHNSEFEPSNKRRKTDLLDNFEQMDLSSNLSFGIQDDLCTKINSSKFQDSKASDNISDIMKKYERAPIEIFSSPEEVKPRESKYIPRSPIQNPYLNPVPSTSKNFEEVKMPVTKERNQYKSSENTLLISSTINKTESSLNSADKTSPVKCLPLKPLKKLQMTSGSSELTKEMNEYKSSENTRLVSSSINKTADGGLNSADKTSPVKCLPLQRLKTMQVTSGKFKVRVKFKKVIEKLRRKNDKWFIKIEIEDETDSMDISVDDGLIEKLIGCSFTELRKYMAQGDTKQFGEYMDVFKSKLRTLDGAAEITFTNKSPTLSNIL